MKTLYLLPFLAALIGWITNYLAIKMLFHPKQPINFGLFVLQGVFPKRQKAFARQIGTIIAQELFSADDIKDIVKESNATESVKTKIDNHVDDFIENRFNKKFPMIATFASDDLLQKFKKVLMEELDDVLPTIQTTYTQKIQEDIDVEEIIAEKVEQFSSDKLEAILFSIMKKEFRFVEFIGAVIGFIIGLFQISMLLW